MHTCKYSTEILLSNNCLLVWNKRLNSQQNGQQGSLINLSFYILHFTCFLNRLRIFIVKKEQESLESTFFFKNVF